jgi:hypothetical protein
VASTENTHDSAMAAFFDSDVPAAASQAEAGFGDGRAVVLLRGGFGTAGACAGSCGILSGLVCVRVFYYVPV